MEWARLGFDRIKASPGAVGFCPGCGAQLHPKCGEINVWHWAHAGGDCDPWHEGETSWHLNWKALFPPDWQEVVMGPRRADIRTPRFVIELQHSPISPAEIREREEFYGEMIWIFDVRSARTRIHFPQGGFSPRPHGSIVWLRPRRSIFTCTKPVLLHLGKGRLYNAYGWGHHGEINFNGGFSHTYTKDQFLTAVGLLAEGANPAPEFKPFGFVPDLSAARVIRPAPLFQITPAPSSPTFPSQSIPLHRFSLSAVRGQSQVPGSAQ